MESLKLHHFGIVVSEIEQTRTFLRDALHYRERTGVIHDRIQTAYVQFFSLPGADHYLELVSPDGDSSKLRNACRNGSSPHHVCFSCESAAQTTEMLRRFGCLVIQEAVPGAAFDGRCIAWLMSPDGLLLELVERGPAGSL